MGKVKHNLSISEDGYQVLCCVRRELAKTKPKASLNDAILYLAGEDVVVCQKAYQREEEFIAGFGRSPEAFKLLLVPLLDYYQSKINSAKTADGGVFKYRQFSEMPHQRA